jgi:L-serine/L-threonine ammonia-lyase
MLDKLRAAGAAAVEQRGATWADADGYLRRELLKGDTDVYVPPFDHATIWEAASGIVDECERQLGELDRRRRALARGGAGEGSEREEDAPERIAPDAIVCSVGGGGLFSGLALGVERSPISSRSIILTSETVGADSLITAVEAGSHTSLPGITSIATSLGAVRVCDRAYAYATDGVVDVRAHRVTDAQAVKACVRFADEERMVVEPSCGAALALAYEGVVEGHVKEGGKVVLVVCGGSNVSLGLLARWAGGEV